jgi:hypothetical protein
VGHAGAEIEAGAENLVGISGHHVDAGQLLSSIDEDTKRHAAESLCLAILEEFLVTEGGDCFLRLVAGHDALVFEEEVGVLSGKASELRENNLAFFKPAVADEPAGTVLVLA